MADPALAQFEAERDRLALVTRFLPYTWLYRSRGYAFLAIGIAIVATAGIFVVRKPLYATVPLMAAACYAVAVVMLWMEVGALKRKEGRG